VLAGALEADGGRISLGGQPYAPRNAQQARERGVAMVYQEPQLCPDLSVAENVLLGLEPGRWGWINKRQMAKQTESALEQVSGSAGSARLRPDDPVASLAPAERQLVAIARALAQTDCRLLILDEPTSSLAADDVERLFAAVRRLRERGLAILYISHFLEEVQQIADRYTVLRDGKTVASGTMAETALSDVVEQMVGRQVDELFTRSVHQPGEVLLELDALGGFSKPTRASLALCRGEVLGIGGLVGSGRTELLRAVFGLDPVRSGTIRVGVHLGPASPARRLAQGVGMLSEDRKDEGLALGMSVADNLTLSKLSGTGPAGLVLPGAQRRLAGRWIERLAIRCRDPGQRAADLSGGNQQKLALARLLYHDVDVLLLDEPTRGVDIASRAEVYRLVDELASQGKGVLMVSSYLPELMGLCDRIAVMQRGVLGPARPTSDLDERAVLAEAAGA